MEEAGRIKPKRRRHNDRPTFPGWTDSLVAYTRHMPPQNIDEFVSEMTDYITIMKLDTRYYLKYGSDKPQSYSTLEGAIDVGNRIYDNKSYRINENLTKSVGLDPAVWNFRSLDKIVWFENAEGADRIRIERRSSNRWNLYLNDSEIGVASSPSMVIDLYLNTPVPSRSL